MSRDRAHMSAIGREGGHSRGARARAAAQGDNAPSDFTRDTGSQSFERQVTTERGAFENAPRPASSGSQRSNYGSSSDRGNGRERNERQGDTPSDHRPFSGRDEI